MKTGPPGAFFEYMCLYKKTELEMPDTPPKEDVEMSAAEPESKKAKTDSK